jgi:hypothetical protein
MPARVATLPFNKELPINHTNNRVFMQALFWTPTCQPWTREFEPTSGLIRTWDQISLAQALAALPPKLQHLADSLTEGFAFALKWQAEVDRDQRRGRTELCAGMEVGIQVPGQRSRREVSR